MTIFKLLLATALTALPLAATAQTDKPWEDIIASMEGTEFLVCPESEYFPIIAVQRDDTGRIVWHEKDDTDNAFSRGGQITVIIGPTTIVLTEDRFVELHPLEVRQGTCFNATEDFAFAISIISR